MQAFFYKNIGEWTDTLLLDFMTKRYRLMTEGPGNICNPASPKVAPYAPFQSEGYEHERLLGDAFDTGWQQIRGTDPRKLLRPNPFELSPFRASTLDPDPNKSVYKFRCWDSAIGIPACAIRGDEPKTFQHVPIVRRSNEHWTGAALPAILRTGPLGKDGALLRPRGKHIFDLTCTKRTFAWDLLEMSHTMAHQYDEVRSGYRHHSQFLGRTAGRYRGALAEIVHAIMYGLPIDVSLRDRNKPGEPDTYFGTELKSTTNFRHPVIRLPWKTREAPRPDSALSVALAAIFIQPHPHGFTTGTGEFELEDMWCCSPSVVALVGWEGIDMITHQEVGYNMFDRKRKGNYVIPADDLLPPAEYWAYLALAMRTGRGDSVPLFEPPEQAVARSMAAIARAEQAEAQTRANARLSAEELETAIDKVWQAERPNIRWVYPREWLATGHYRWLYVHTPPLPCKFCLDINHNAEGAPERPKGKRPTGARKTWPKDWVRWEQDLTKIRAIVRNAVVSYESKRYGTKTARIRRRARTQGARTRYAQLRLLQKAEAVREKQRQGRDPTPSEWNAYFRVQRDV
jgi:hypothetical protein